jgi:hypothetical protein
VTAAGIKSLGRLRANRCLTADTFFRTFLFRTRFLLPRGGSSAEHLPSIEFFVLNQKNGNFLLKKNFFPYPHPVPPLPATDQY